MTPSNYVIYQLLVWVICLLATKVDIKRTGSKYSLKELGVLFVLSVIPVVNLFLSLLGLFAIYDSLGSEEPNGERKNKK